MLDGIQNRLFRRSSLLCLISRSRGIVDPDVSRSFPLYLFFREYARLIPEASDRGLFSSRPIVANSLGPLFFLLARPYYL